MFTCRRPLPPPSATPQRSVLTAAARLLTFPQCPCMHCWHCRHLPRLLKSPRRQQVGPVEAFPMHARRRLLHLARPGCLLVIFVCMVQ